MWSPTKSGSTQGSKTRDQCNAVKALLFSDSPSPATTQETSSSKSKGGESTRRSRSSRVRETKENEKNEGNKPNGNKTATIVEAKSGEKVDKKTTKGGKRGSSTSKKNDTTHVVIDAPRDPNLTD